MEVNMKLKSFLCVLALVFSLPTLAETTGEGFPTESSTERLASSYGGGKTISNGQYIGGGIATLFLGWGIGHAVQGRYGEKGWIFTAGGAVFTIGLSGVLYSTLKAAEENPDDPSLSGLGYGFLGLWLVGTGVKIWELIDVWMLPSHYKVVKESPFQIKPLAFYDQNTDLNLGLSLNYKF